MPVVVDQLIDQLADKQDAEASPAQTLLFTHGGVPNGIVIRVIDRCVVQGTRIETMAGVGSIETTSIPADKQAESALVRPASGSVPVDRLAKKLPKAISSRLVDCSAAAIMTFS